MPRLLEIVSSQVSCTAARFVSSLTVRIETLSSGMRRHTKQPLQALSARADERAVRAR